MSKSEEQLKAFILAIRLMKKIKVEFIAKQDKQIKIRKCAPYDYGPYKNGIDSFARYHMWDYESYKGSHYLALLPEQVLELKIIDEKFEPKDIINWDFEKGQWHIKRNWGEFS